MAAADQFIGETKRLTLRTPVEGDLDLIGELWTDPDVTQHVGGPRVRDDVVDFFREYATDPETCAREEGEQWWSIVERASGAFLGLCSLMEKEIEGRVETELDYFLLPAAWGRGYATEAARVLADYAFSTLGLTSLVAIIDPHNAPSVRVAQKLGMAMERAALRPDGVVRHVYRLERSVWQRR